MASPPSRRVVSVAPMPPEKSAYALARYSRSPDSIVQSVEWVRTHNSQSFLESYYFQYGHASIADLGHATLSFEGISELAATEVEDENLWDGQAKSTRYQDFSSLGVVTPPELEGAAASAYERACDGLLAAYRQVQEVALGYLTERLPRPESMKPDAYRRNLAARAFDIARYLLFLGIPTNIGQVTSIRTLERQIRRLGASPYGELRQLAQEIAAACARPPECEWQAGAVTEPLAPTLARHADPDAYLAASRQQLRAWAEANLHQAPSSAIEKVDLLRPAIPAAEAAASLLYSVTAYSYRELYELAAGWSEARRAEVIDVACGSRGRRDDLLLAFRGGPYVYDIVADIGAYRDLHRHRRCQQLRQEYTGALGWETPPVMQDAGVAAIYEDAMRAAAQVRATLPARGADYLLPFGARLRFLFKMDFAEAEYIAKLRSGVKGHFSYREVAWLMKERMAALEPELGRLMEATPPWVEDPLQR